MLLGLSLPGSALALDDNSSKRLERVQGQVANVEARLDRVSRDVTERAGFIGSLEARRRYEDAVFNYLLGQYDQAAREFFTLLESGALGSSPEFKDSQWYLAECLFELRNYTLAVEAYQVMVDSGTQHPFFADAVRRLLEIHGITGNADAFYSIYNAYIITNRVEPSDVVKYTLAKSFYRQGENARAKAMMGDVAPGGAYYARARYFLGTILVVEGEYGDAIEQYKLAADAPLTTVEDREVVDLANLALGRLYYEIASKPDDYEPSIQAYLKINRSSKYFPDALYEMSWTSIKQGEFKQALESVDMFLLAYPEHRYSARLKLDQGHLFRQQEHYDSALESYQNIVDSYTPIRDHVDSIQQDPLGPLDWFTRLASAQDLNAYFGGELPVFALEMLVNDPEVGRALATYRELLRQRQDVEESKGLIEEIDAALQVGTVGTFQRGGVELSGIDIEVLRLKGELLYLEEAWLLSELSGGDAGAVRDLRDEREALSRKAGEKSAGDGQDGFGADKASLAQGYTELQKKLNGMRARVQASDAAQVGRSIDDMWSRLAQVKSGAASLDGRLGDLEAGELGTIRSSLEAERLVVGDSDSQLGVQLIEAEQLSGQVTRKGLAKLSLEFNDSVLNADKGIVDVYWVKLVNVSDDRKTLLNERKALLTELDQQFKVVRQGLPETETPNPLGGQSSAGQE